MNCTSDDEMDLPDLTDSPLDYTEASDLLGNLRDCLCRLDQIGANTAAAHVDAAIHALLSSLESGDQSKTD